MILYVVVAIILPLVTIAWVSLLPFLARPSAQTFGLLSLGNFTDLLGDARFIDAVINTLIVGIVAGTVTMVMAAVIAWIVYRTTLTGRSVLDFLAFVPIAVPGIVLGMALITLYVAFPVAIYGTIWLLIVAFITKYLPYGMRTSSGSVLQIHRELEEAGSMSGASWFTTFRSITIPLMWPGLLAGWLYIVLVSFREFSTSILLSGPQSQVLSIFIYRLYERGQTTPAAASGVLMLIPILVIIALTFRLTGRIGLAVAPGGGVAR
jgi:iron(III) transport system permease protein